MGAKAISRVLISGIVALMLCPAIAFAGVGANATTNDSRGLAMSGFQMGEQAATRVVNGVTLEQGSGVWTVTGYSGSATSLNLNSLGVGVITGIGSGAFSGCTTLKSITLPSTLQSIGSYAFEGCTGLSSITLPESLTDISYHAFRNCTGLSSVAVRSRDLSASDRVFTNAGTGTSGIVATFASTCGAVPYGFFRASDGTPKLKSVNVAAGVKTIGSAAFESCASLGSVILGSGITAIESGAFEGCSGVKSIALPSTLQSIGSYAFEGCTGLSSITLPESLTDISYHAFRNCTGLSSVAVRSRDLSASDRVFTNAGTGTSGIVATFASTCKAVPSGFFRASDGAPKLKKVTVSSGVKEIGWSAFEGCTSLVSVSLPASIASIGTSAFYDCSSLKAVTVPHNVSADDVGRYAFENMGLGSKVTVTTGEQYKRLRNNSDYITTTRTKVVLAANSLYRAKVKKVSNKIWTGKRINPSPRIVLGSKVLQNGSDYTLAYKSNKALGLATIIAKGKGKYVGTKTIAFRIVPPKITGVKAKSGHSKSVVISWSNKKARKAGAEGYQVCYKVAGKKARYDETSWSSDSNMAIYGLPKGKKVSVKVRAYTSLNGKRAYGPWSATKKTRVRS